MHESLIRKVVKMLNDIEDVENRREEVIKKKFTDPNFVSS